MNMEIVSIEKKDFRDDGGGIRRTLGEGRRPEAQKRHGAHGKMVTGEEVCGQLRISPRTLQTLRDRRLIGYSQINRRSITSRRR